MGVVYALTPASVSVSSVFVSVLCVLLLALWWSKKDENLPYRQLEYVGGSKGTAHRLEIDLTGKLVSIFLLTWWAAILMVNRIGTSDVWSDSAAIRTTQDAAANGSAANQLLVVSYGAVGILFLVLALTRSRKALRSALRRHAPRRADVSAVKRSRNALRWILILSLLYLCWGCVSLLWSVDPYLTVRRLGAFTLVWLASLGFGAGFYGGRPDGRSLFLRHAVLAGILAALVQLIPWALHVNAADLLDPGYVVRPRSNIYSGVAQPTLAASLILVATAMLHVRKWQRYDWALVVILMLAPVFVLKTRGPILATILALGIVYFCYKIRAGEWLRPIGLLLAVPVGMGVLYVAGALDRLIPYLTRNHPESLLTGRGTLWEALIPNLKQHALAGVGFGAYWNPSNLARLQENVFAAAVNAHNGYIDEILATGIIGLSLLLIFWACATVMALDRIRKGDNFGWLVILFVVWYMLNNLTQSIMQQYLEIPFIFPLILISLMVSRNADNYPSALSEPATHPHSQAA